MKEIVRQINKPVCLALGFFDCLHVVHRKIIADCVDFASKNGCKSAVFTFKDEGMDAFKGQLIYTYSERKQIIGQMGVDYLMPFVFDDDCKKTDKRSFLEKLCSLAQVKAIFCGFDYTFGYKGEGNVEYLRKYCEEKGIKLCVMQCEKLFDEKISSTMIKRFLSAGNIEKANELLTNRYFMSGTVVKGRGEGHVFGFPTANLHVSFSKMLPKYGVYATYSLIDGKRYASVTNVGAKPTFGIDSVTVETLIKDFDGDLYGKEIKLEFVRYLRTVRSFDSPEQLREQIFYDILWEKIP